jgi:hypothetical protein
MEDFSAKAEKDARRSLRRSWSGTWTPGFAEPQSIDNQLLTADCAENGQGGTVFAIQPVGINVMEDE